jgi:tetratricopeptide (TPR) repeat protein
LALEPRNVTALSRLSDVAFDRGQYQDAADYAEKAVGISPRNAGLHLKLGDAYFKLRNYSRAREHYERALALGNRAAERRLERVDEKGG